MKDTKQYGFSLDLDAFGGNLEQVMHLTEQMRERALVRLPELRFFGLRYRLPNGAVFVGQRCLDNGTELSGIRCIEFHERLPGQVRFNPNDYYLTRFAQSGENLTIVEWGKMRKDLAWQATPTMQKCYSDYMISKKHIENKEQHEIGSIDYCRDVLQGMISAAPPTKESQGLKIYDAFYVNVMKR